MGWRDFRINLACLAACCLATMPAHGGSEAFSLYLVRHAEKTTETQDPGLTDAGAERARMIAAGLSGRDIDAVWSSPYRRSLDTARPLAEKLGVTVGHYDPRAQEDFSEHLLAASENALVVGHSNTIPELAALLCGCEVDAMDHDEYDRLIVVTWQVTGAVIETVRQSEFFGAKPAP